MKLPLKGCSNRDPTQIWRCRKHKRIEGKCLLTLPHGASFLDCGSHFGDTTLTMAVHARANGRDDLRFIAFEPSRRKCKFIRSMVKANGLENSVKIVNACIGDHHRKVRQIDEKGFEKYDGRVAYCDITSMLPDEGDAEDATQTHSIPISIDKRELGIGKKSLFYFDGQHVNDSNDSSSESNSDDEDESDNEDAEQIPMISLDHMKEEILPLGLLHLDVEGWEARALKGAQDILSQINATCFIVAEIWDEKDRKKRQKAVIDPDCESGFDVLAAMKPYQQFERLPDIIDQDRNLFFQYNR